MSPVPISFQECCVCGVCLFGFFSLLWLHLVGIEDLGCFWEVCLQFSDDS